MKITIEIPDDYCMDWLREKYCPCYDAEFIKCQLYNTKLEREKLDEDGLDQCLAYKCDKCKEVAHETILQTQTK